MSELIIQISTMEIKIGKLEAFKESVTKSVTFVKENGPQLMAEIFIDEEKMLAHSCQVIPDSESILSHWQMSDPYLREVDKHMIPKRVDIYGKPNGAVLKGMRVWEEMGVIVTVTPHFFGFNRFQNMNT